MFASTASLHISGFFAGEKPSRNQASTLPAGNCGNASATSLITSVRRTRPPAKLQRFQPGTRRCQRANSVSACACNSGHSANAARNSSSLNGNFSTLKKSRLAPSGATCSNNCQAQRKFSPVPKPVSPMQKLSPADNAAKRSAKRLPCRNTWRVSSRPESVEKYTSP